MNPGSPSRVRLVALLSAGLLAISFGSILVRFSQEAPSLVIAFNRMLWATLILAPFYFARGRGPSSGPWLLRFVAGLALSLHFAFWIGSLRFTSVAVSVLLVNTSPVLVALSSWLFFRERLTPWGILGIGCAFAGAMVLLWDDLQTIGDWRGGLLAILGAIALGIYLLVGRKLRQTASLLEYVFPTYFLAACLLGLLVLASGQAFTGYSKRTYLFFFLLGLVPQCIGHTSYNWALRYLSATVVSVLVLSEPLFATLLAWWILSETVGPVAAVGAILVGAGILAVSLRGIQPKRDEP